MECIKKRCYIAPFFSLATTAVSSTIITAAAE